MSNIIQIETAVKKVVETLNKDTFIYDLLLAYDTPKAAIARLLRGNQNIALFDEDVIWKKKLFFRVEKENALHTTIAELAKSSDVLKFHPRFIVVTDFKRILALDTKRADSLDTSLAELPVHYAFFLPLAGMEKSAVQVENPADVKAAERMAKLFDEIKRDNPTFADEYVHGLNVFLTRLLFCFFAEDTGIFSQGVFNQTLNSYTQADGSDLDEFLTRLFTVLNTPESLRKDLPDYLMQFPYVNGGLFERQFPMPRFSMRSRNAIIKSGELNWAAINPDIFGSMIQNVVTEEDRGDMGIHYTSVPNIMKVIEPLFLNELYDEFDKAIHPDESIKNPKKYKEDKLKVLLSRIANIRIFDPACGSGNFLIIAYRELRKLEIKILKELDLLSFSSIQLSNFYGIEIADFSCEVAMLSLWLAEHQMNLIFKAEFNQCNPTLPLHEAGHIVCANATCKDWAEVCPKNGMETYILGNPPYLGSSMQDEKQKKELADVCNEFANYKNLDYIACWFYLGAKYISGTKMKLAFVSTNSICQGDSVGLLWPNIFDIGIDIFFAYESFKWANNAKYNAGVTCTIIGLKNKNIENNKVIFGGKQIKIVKNISPYLHDGNNTIVFHRATPIANFPPMAFGSKPTDGGFLILSPDEKSQILKNAPQVEPIIKGYMGADDLINSIERYCLWITAETLFLAQTSEDVRQRLSQCAEFRRKSKASCTVAYAGKPHLFKQRAHKNTSSIIIPSVSSERREYIPMGFVDRDTVVSNAANAIFDAQLWVFSIITSKMHMVWVRMVGGRLETRIRYSATLCYNTFPFPDISEKQKAELSEYARQILFCREMESEKTLAELYDPDKMPQALKEAHHQLDLAVERCYRSNPFESDEERLEYLFKLYEKMIAEERM